MFIVKATDAQSVRGGSAVMLCDERGQPLPNQIRILLDQGVGESSTITVTFVIDGEAIRVE